MLKSSEEILKRAQKSLETLRKDLTETKKEIVEHKFNDGEIEYEKILINDCAYEEELEDIRNLTIAFEQSITDIKAFSTMFYLLEQDLEEAIDLDCEKCPLFNKGCERKFDESGWMHNDCVDNFMKVYREKAIKILKERGTL